ncbi:MAG TPA: Crp/Fnr family transcriptional regulator [Sedimenticola sp.]|nr:Crp/Fnr family transcriptional regulator [Sedimenticola sp.]
MKTVTPKEAWAGEADCQTCALRDTVLFAGLQEKDFECIHSPIDVFLLPAGSILYRAGDEGRYLYTIRRGLVKLVQYLPDGGQRIVRLLQGTDVAGLEALLGQGYQHDAVMLQTTEVCRLPVKVVRCMDKENPVLHRELMARWQRALSEADAWLTELSTGSARQRVARLLLRLVRRQEGDQCELFHREDMGAMLGLTTETASRTIAEFKRRGLLAETAPNHYLCDIPNLELIAEG